MKITIPVRVRVIAYLLTMLPFTAVVAWASASGYLTPAASVLVGSGVACLHTIAGSLALSHLTLPDVGPLPDAGPSLDPSTLDPTAVDVTPDPTVTAPNATVPDAAPAAPAMDAGTVTVPAAAAVTVAAPA